MDVLVGPRALPCTLRQKHESLDENGGNRMKLAALRFAVIVVALSAAPMTSRPVWAGDGAPAEEPGAATSDMCIGKLHAIDAEKCTVTIRHKKENTTFTVAADCQFIGYDKDDATLADLKVGDRARVSWTEEGDEQVAHQIEHAVTKDKSRGE